MKDKQPLTERKDKIEVLMDHFKDFERESKTKRYSQVGVWALPLSFFFGVCVFFGVFF